MFTGLAEPYPPQGVTEAQRVDKYGGHQENNAAHEFAENCRERPMSKRLGKNLEDADSRRLWEAAERAAANRRKLVVLVSELKNLVSESGAITKKSYYLFAEKRVSVKKRKRH